MAELQGDLGKLQLRFWGQLLNRALERGILHHAGCRPVPEGFLSAGAGRSWLTYEYQIYVRDKAAVQLYTSHDHPAVNELRAEWFLARRSEIEAKWGAPLDHHPAKDTSQKRNCSLFQAVLPGGGLRDSGDRWPAIQEEMITTMDRFVRMLQPYIEQAPL